MDRTHGYYFDSRFNECVAQLDRAPVCGTGGYGFESHRVHYSFEIMIVLIEYIK